MAKQKKTPDVTSAIVSIPAAEFARCLKFKAKRPDARFTFFLGAGCSVTSGIQDAKSLTQRWVQELKRIRTDNDAGQHKWAAENFRDYTPESAAAHYAAVMKQLFHTAEDRQEEIEAVINRAGMPRFGYAELAQLMTHNKYGPQFSTVLTTNFDDMVADALYLYTHKKPRVIAHESLAGFARVTSSRPLVFKVHGDARLAPKNTDEETRVLEPEVKDKLLALLGETALIFIGYGGHDKSIANLLSELPDDHPTGGIYWVGENIPDTDVGVELKKRKQVFHVNHFDFDELMLLIKSEFDLGTPKGIPHDQMMDTYRDDLTRLLKMTKAGPDTDEKTALTSALGKVAEGMDEEMDWFGVEMMAEKQLPDNPDAADTIYRAGIAKVGETSGLLNNYAVFLKNERKDMDGAEVYYKRALVADPSDADTRGNYAIFLWQERKDMDEAEAHFKRALDTDPNNVHALSRYANFLCVERRDMDGAEDHYKRALNAEPNDGITLGNYVEFLFYAGRAQDARAVLNSMDTRDMGAGNRLGAQAVAYALSPEGDARQDALQQVYVLLNDGASNATWSYDKVLDEAEDIGSVDMAFLRALADVINGKATIESLDAFPEWVALGKD